MQKFRSVVESLPNPRRRFSQRETSQHRRLPVLYVANGYVVTCAIAVIATETHECIDARRLISIAEFTAGFQGRIIQYGSPTKMDNPPICWRELFVNLDFRVHPETSRQFVERPAVGCMI